ncbi:MAG: 50S ribosomal protein L3 [Candidatus Jordarchaeum sp.]|uniref:50S ribosomal protein L3 n=1 Tax=Candidatus Jordarchaeum sp. TaxID=2823881 RepID=UPI0040490716
MGHRKTHAPKRGSLAYLPRGRASSSIGHIRNWPEYDESPTILGAAGYKAGMTHVLLIEDHSYSPYFGQERVFAATVIETPPIISFGIRAYNLTPYGLHALTEVWMPELSNDLRRNFTLPVDYDYDKALNQLEEKKEKISEIRALLHTQPRLASVPKIKPDIVEIKIGGGSIEEQINYSKQILGKQITIGDIFKEGDYIDVIGITKGKGFQGPVKRWGIRILQHKSRKTKRGVGAIGPWRPARVSYTVPRAGQMGYHQRTEYNKRILKIGERGEEISPSGGFIRYGLVRGNYLLLQGSVPGPPKRLITLRYPIRPPINIPEVPPTISYVSTKSKQGV